ncbi:MAG: CPBP family intramembrane metalloprotease [Acidimicrobiia bacterium]|nr:CPBP family intramembrane metalloprotease [Acidimicrobiia bacterium]
MTVETSERYLSESPWTGNRTIGVFVGWLVGGLVGGIVAALVGFDPLVDAAGLTVVIAFQTGAALLAVTLYGQSVGTGSLAADVGLVLRPRQWYGIPLGFAAQWAAGLILVPLVEVLNLSDAPQAVSDIAGDTLDTPGRVLLFISFVIVGPLGEEIVFRGVLLAWLSRRMGPTAAVFVSAAAFGLIHWEGPDTVAPVVGLFLIGLVLGYAAIRQGNLSLALWIHAGVNLLAFLVLIYEDRIIEWIEELESGLNLVRLWFG